MSTISVPFEIYFCKILLVILFGYYGLMLAEKCVLNLIQRDLLLSLTTLGSILSFVILTFWELILVFGVIF